MASWLIGIQNSTMVTVSKYVPSVLAVQQHPYLAASVTALLSLPLLFYILTKDWQSNLPPRMSYFFRAITGGFNLEKRGPIELIRQGYVKYGEIFRIKMFHRGLTFLVGPEAHALFFEASDEELSQKEVYIFTVPVFGKNIVYDAPPNIMIQQLKFVRHGLTGPAMKAHCQKIVKETEDFFRAWGNEGKIDLKKALSELTILTASRCLLGAEVREHLHKEVADLYEYLNKGLTEISFFYPYAPTPAHRARDRAREKIVAIFSRVILKRREDAAKGLIDETNKPDDFLQTLIDASYRDGSQPTEDEISGLLLAALFAGQHTSSISSTWTGMLILDKQEQLVPRLLAEQKTVLTKSNGELTVESLSEMTLLHNCMKEALRLFPPLIMLFRKVLKEQHYKGYLIPKGDIVVTSPPIAHRLPEYFKDCEDFNPDRFDPEHDESAPKFAYIPFGGGRHTCLGNHFAFLQVKTIWSTLLRNFDFTLPQKFVPQVDYSSMVAGPKNDCTVYFRRKPASEVF